VFFQTRELRYHGDTQVCHWFTDSVFNYLGLVFPLAVAAWYYEASLPILFTVSLTALVGLSNLLWRVHSVSPQTGGGSGAGDTWRGT